MIDNLMYNPSKYNLVDHNIVIGMKRIGKTYKYLNDSTLFTVNFQQVTATKTSVIDTSNIFIILLYLSII